MTDTLTVSCELTDTFAGDANYSWVKRASVTIPRDLSDRALVRRCKAALGLSGVRGTMARYNGDTFEFRPYRACVVAFFTVDY